MSMSTISSYEKACLVANYHALSVKESIDPRIKSMGYTPEQLQMLEKQTITHQTSINSCGLLIDGDLKQFIESNLGYYLEAFSAYDNHGILPYQGSFSDQPAKILDIFGTFTQIQSEEENRIKKQIDREQKRRTDARS